MSEENLGACHKDKNPDAWFPQMPNGGRLSTVLRRMVPEIQRALDLCETCPLKAKCLELGMQPNNLGHGIWGGMLSGDRIHLSDSLGVEAGPPAFNRGRVLGSRNEHTDDNNYLTSDDRAWAHIFTDKIKPLLEEARSNAG